LGRKACFKQKAKLFLFHEQSDNTFNGPAAIRLNGHFGNNNPRHQPGVDVAS